MKIKRYCYFYLFLLTVFAVPLPALGQNTGDSLSQENDCSDTSIDFTDSGTPLTIDEKIARMDNAFYASLNKFDRCQTSTENQSSSSASASQSSRDNNDGTTGVKGTENTMQRASSGGSSVASAAVSGTSPPPPDARIQQEKTQTQESKNSSGGTPTSLQSANGKAPDDIPPGNNDSILEAQIRAAAIAENDPVRKRRLWDEYRRYKGLKIPANNMEK